MRGGVGRRAVTVAAGTRRIHIALQLLERLVPCERQSATTAVSNRFHFRFTFALMLLMQIQDAVVDVLVGFGGFRGTLAAA